MVLVSKGTHTVDSAACLKLCLLQANTYLAARDHNEPRNICGLDIVRLH